MSSTTYKRNGREIKPEASVDFDWAAVDKDEAAEEGDRQAGVEFELAQRFLMAIRDAVSPALAADQIAWLMNWTKMSTHTLADRHDYSQPGFLKGARKLAEDLGLKLSPAHLQAITEATD